MHSKNGNKLCKMEGHHNVFVYIISVIQLNQNILAWKTVCDHIKIRYIFLEHMFVCVCSVCRPRSDETDFLFQNKFSFIHNKHYTDLIQIIIS